MVADFADHLTHPGVSVVSVLVQKFSKCLH
jgi:hypothetical protein